MICSNCPLLKILSPSVSSISVPMATINKTLKPKPKPRSPVLTLFIFLAATALLCLFSLLVFTNGFSLSSTKTTLKNLVNPGNKNSRTHVFPDNVLYWGNIIDSPGKHCESCEGLGHQESSLRYKMAYSSNFSRIIDPLIENNYQLFMIERLIMMGAKTFIRTYKEDDTDISLTDDPKMNTKRWQIPVHTTDEEGS